MPKPFQPIALGLIIVLLTATAGGFDLLADPVGWLVVLGALGGLPEVASLHRARVAVVLAMLTSIPLAWPAWRDAVADADPSLGWTASLPQLVALILLVQVMLEAARAGEAARAASRLALTRTFAIVVALLPILVFGAHLDAWTSAAGALATLVALAIIVQLLVDAAQPWARRQIDQTATKSDDGS